MTKAIVFDLGGVLVDLDMDACRRAFREDLGFARISEILDPCHQKGIFMEMEAGRISADEFRAAVLAESRPGAVPEDIDRCISALLVRMDAYKVTLLERLATRYDLYILSNNNPVLIGKRCHSFPAFLREGFSRWILKSRNRIEHLRTGVAPAEILFIDDSPRNVEAAAAAGMRSALYVQGEDLEELIEKHIEP